MARSEHDVGQQHLHLFKRHLGPVLSSTERRNPNGPGEVTGLVVVNLVKPGVGLDFDVWSLDRAVNQDLLSKAHAGGHGSFLLHIIPSSFLGAFASGALT